MTEITRVPLQPIAKGALTKLWLGVAAAALAAGGLAWYTLPPSVELEVRKAGTGASPTKDDVVFIKYVGKLADGTVFDKSPDQPSPLPGLIPEGVPNLANGFVEGFNEGILKMQRGGKYTLSIPAAKAYGATPPPESPIPANADLVFEVELVDFMPRAEAEQRFQMFQQLAQQAQQKAAGGKGGQPGGPQGGPPGGPPAGPGPQGGPPVQ